jgi:hypothetical protein
MSLGDNISGSGAMRGGLALVMGGGIMGSLYYLVPSQYYYVLLIGLAVGGLLVAAYGGVLRGFKQRRARRMEEGIIQDASVVPRNIKDPGQRARLEEMRKAFESGIGKFRVAGRKPGDPSRPWYVIVGEPASGKTEALRHCGIVLPTMQDPLQGVGGTINMDWWFTKYAVILDTAGRMLFENVQAGGGNEWREFLSLLKKHRRDYPINGMFLTISADSLIKYPLEKLDQQAADTSRQLDLIQRTLNVRFPVYVLITKADLIHGFREFFDTMNEPEQQNQILGWTNPDSLDAPFNPEQVDKHLETVLAQLRRRRLTQLKQPLLAEHPPARVADEVDAMYDFPQSLSRMVPRLRRYLEVVFSANEWSAKPMFFRGIYFTSAMREGSALDSCLAEALGVPVDSLMDMRKWERDRTYFLRDVFVEKAFPEMGLVTPAVNAGKHYWRQKAMVLGAAIVAVVALLGLTLFGRSQLRDSIGTHRDNWVAAASNWDTQKRIWKRVIEPESRAPEGSSYLYKGGETIEVGDAKEKVPVVEFLGRLHSGVYPLKKINVPWVFFIANAFTTDMDGSRLKADRAIVKSSLFDPLMEAVRKRLEKGDSASATATTQPGGDWSDQATTMLETLIRLEEDDPKSHIATQSGISMRDLFRFVLGSTPTGYSDDKDGTICQQILDEGSWTPADLGARKPEAEAAIREGFDRYEKYLNQGEQKAGVVGKLQESLDSYKKVENELIQMPMVPPRDRSDYQRIHNQWRQKLNNLLAEVKRIDLLCSEKLRGKNVAEICESKQNNMPEELSKKIGEFRTKAGIEGAKELQTVVEEGNNKLGELLNNVNKKEKDLKDKDLASAKKMDEEFLKKASLGDDVRNRLKAKYPALKDRLEKNPLRLYECRLILYLLADLQLQQADDDMVEAGLIASSSGSAQVATRPDGAQDLAARMRDLGEQMEIAPRDLTELAAGPPKTVSEAIAAGKFIIIETSWRARTLALDTEALAGAPSNLDGIHAAVQALAVRMEPVNLPLTGFDGKFSFEPQFHPDAAQRVNGIWSAMEKTWQSDAPLLERDHIKQQLEAIQKAFNDYSDEYVEYWSRTIPDKLKLVDMQPDWKKVQGLLNDAQEPFPTAAQINGQFKLLCELVDKALVAEFIQDSRLKKKSETEAVLGRAAKGALKAKDTVFTNECGQYIVSWKNPSAGAVLQNSIGFVLPVKPEEKSDFVTEYWRDFTFALLCSFVDSEQETIRRDAESAKDAFEEFRVHYGKFPLSQYSGDDQLSEPDVKEAAQKLKAYDALVKNLPGAEGAKLTEVPRINERLSRLEEKAKVILQGSNLHRDEEKWINGVRELLGKLLMKNGDTAKFTVNVSVVNAEDQKREKSDAYGTWTWIAAEQLQGNKRKDRTGPAKSALLVALGCPGTPVKFDFFLYSDDPNPDISAQVGNPWAGLLLIHQFHVGKQNATCAWVASKTEAKKWRARVTLSNGGNKKDLLLDLDASVDFPDFDNWPVVPAKRP